MSQQITAMRKQNLVVNIPSVATQDAIQDLSITGLNLNMKKPDQTTISLLLGHEKPFCT